ncbi:MAG TPA: SDR family oxidoreductase [Acidimicrobiales bacterium]
MSPSGRRVAVVTGGSGGIGSEVCRRLGSDGFAVVVGFAGRREEADTTAKAVNEAGGEGIAIQVDVAEESQVVSLFDQAEADLGGVDVVVHLAGIMPLATLADLDLRSFDQIIRINLRGTFVVNQQAAKRLRAGGAIINFTSSVVKLAFPGFSAYAASKGGVEALTMILARELRGRDITVNAIGPGPTATPLMLNAESDDRKEELTHMSPLERLGHPTDISEVVAFLAGPARWVNGQVLYVNGGII